MLFSHSVMSNSLWPHWLKHARSPCPSPSPRVCLNFCPSSQWFHPSISSSVIPFSSCLQSFPASGSFPMVTLHIRWTKYWSFGFSPSNEYSLLISFRIDWFDLLAIQGTLKSLLQHHNSKAFSFSLLSLFNRPTIIQFVVIYTVKGFRVVNEADVFLEFSSISSSEIFPMHKATTSSCFPIMMQRTDDSYSWKWPYSFIKRNHCQSEWK